MPRKTRPSVPSGNPLVAIGYLRVSTEEQHLGPAAQRAAMERWATANGVTIAAWHEDHQTGGAPVSTRVELIAAVASIAEHHAGILLVAKRDRLARDSMNAAMIDAMVERQGARVRSAAGEGTESDDPTAILFRRMVDAFAEYERLVISARTTAALAVKRSRGERTGNLPLGRFAADGVHHHEPAEWTAGRAHARILRSQGESLRDIGAALALRGLRPSRRGAPKASLIPGEGSWSAAQVKRFIEAG